MTTEEHVKRANDEQAGIIEEKISRERYEPGVDENGNSSALLGKYEADKNEIEATTNFANCTEFVHDISNKASVTGFKGKIEQKD